MDRRYINFFITACALIMLFQLMNRQALVNPNPNDDPAAQQEEQQITEEDNSDSGDAPAEGDEPADPPIEAPQVNSPPYVTLGSIDPNGAYRMAATFDTAGATIRRLQFSSMQYRDLHDLAGFLGQLELKQGESGPIVQSVTPGSPAALAGIQKGDVLVSLDPPKSGNQEAIPLSEATSLALALADFKPGEQATITVNRDGTDQKLTAKLIRRPLDLIRPEAENIMLHSEQLPDDFEQHPSLEISISKVESPNAASKAALKKANNDLVHGVWAVDETVADQLTFSKVLPDLGLEVVKRFKIAKSAQDEDEDEDAEVGSYHLEFDVEIRNLLAKPQNVQYELQGPNGLPIEGFWYANKVGRKWSGYGIRDVLIRTYGSDEMDYACRNIAKGKVPAYGDGESLAYIGVDAQYFAATIVPLNDSTDQRWYNKFTPNLASTLFDEKSSYHQKYQNASFLLTSSELNLAPKDEAGSTQTHATQLFTGPKQPALLAKYTMPADPEESLEDFVYYGWFGNLGIPQLMVGILSFFYSFFGNYGLAIFCLTVVARGIMTPLSRKQAKNMALMQELKPEIDRLKARYKDDTQAQMRAQNELFAKHNYNPMGGCLLMFIQLPIFIGLYRALMVDVDLRQASLIPGLHWCSNLAAPDMLFDWSGFSFLPQWFLNGEGMFAMGPYLNILPVITVGLFLLQQKMFMPPPADEQAEMMQKVMQFMMFFMAFMFFKVASGLCLYFIASSLWGIAERKLIPRPATPGAGASTTTSTVEPKTTNRDSSSNKKLVANKAKSSKGGKRKR